MTSVRIMLALLAGAIVGAIAHERDIALSCERHGVSGYAGWTIAIKCSPMTKDSQP